MDMVPDMSELVYSIDVLDAIYWIQDAIETLPSTVVPNCFHNAGFQFEQTVIDDDEENIPLMDLRVVPERLNFDAMAAEEYASFDDEILTENESDFTLEQSQNCSIDDESDDDEEAGAHGDNITSITHSGVLLMLDRIKEYACKEGLITLLNKNAECANLVKENIIKKQSKPTN